MADKPEEIPAFRITEKRVDDSWKEEVRREREAATRTGAGKPAPSRAAPPHQPEPMGKAETPPQKAPAPQAAEAAEEQPSPPRKPRSESAAGEQQTQIFLAFLSNLAQQALMQLGEIENPYSGRREFDPRGAKYTLELLATIHAKTEGNLSEEEESLLSETIHDLRLRYVELANEMQRQMAAKAAGGGAMRPGPGGKIPG